MSEATILKITNREVIDRTDEALGPTWTVGAVPARESKINEVFWFTGEDSEIPSTISSLIDKSTERLFISTQSFSNSSIIQATEDALLRGVKVYMVLDTQGFESMLKNPSCDALNGNALLRERQERGLDLILADWHLPNRTGMLLSTPLDGTISSSYKGWIMELSESQIDEFSAHIQHEFWSIKEGREVLAPSEAKNPQPIAQAPFTLRPIHNLDHILRSSISREGEDSIAEASLRKESKWEGQIISNLAKSSIYLRGDELFFGTNANHIMYSSPQKIEPSSGKYANSWTGIQLAIGKETYLAGWDRSATGDWHSVLRLDAEQAKAAKALLQKLKENPEWIGHSNIRLGDAGNKIILEGKEMVISDSQIQDLGVINLDEMPNSSEELKAYKPVLTTPKDKLARECEFKWVSAPPVPPSSASMDNLHKEWEMAHNELSERLKELDELNVVSKLPGFGRKAKELQKLIDELSARLGNVTDQKIMSDIVQNVEKLSKEVVGNLKAIKAAEAEEERKKLESEQREKHKLAVEEAKNNIKTIEPRLKKMNAELLTLRKSSEKAEGVEKKKLESDIEQLFPKIQQLGSELKSAKEVSNSKFEFNPPTKLGKTEKGGKKSHKFLGDTQKSKVDIKIPKESLPENGTIFQDSGKRYLAISDWSHVEQGRIDAKRLNAILCASREVLE